MAYPSDGEAPATVFVDPFEIGATAVTNAEFGAFVEATGYVTDAEHFGWSFVFESLVDPSIGPTRGVVGSTWWRQVPGAAWNSPGGGGSNIELLADHPVVHVSWNDASAFCRWAGVRLPTEAEWERAAQGRATTVFPWGDTLEPGGVHVANVFQGTFPTENTATDGWTSTCPVGWYEPHGEGLYNAIGNVWEWTSTWFSAVEREPDSGDRRVMKGGSYLCHHSYCHRYRAAARTAHTPDSSNGNVGFRVAR